MGHHVIKQLYTKKIKKTLIQTITFYILLIYPIKLRFKLDFTTYLFVVKIKNFISSNNLHILI
jgi:hypothetical protein